MFVSSKAYEAALLRAFCGEEINIYAYGELDSTNTEAKRLAVSGHTSAAVIAAESQTAGRGRMGRAFYSPDTTGAYFSFLYTPHQPLDNAVSVTSAAAVAVMKAIYELTGLSCEIKWVNDLYLCGRKVCGILCESLFVNARPQIVVGIGVNLSTKDFPDELIHKAGALGVEVDRSLLIAAVWRRLKPSLESPCDRSWLDAYRAHSCVIGKPIEWVEGDKRVAGIAVGIDCDGGLVVRLSDGTEQTLRTGEISLFVDGINL